MVSKDAHGTMPETGSELIQEKIYQVKDLLAGIALHPPSRYFIKWHPERYTEKQNTGEGSHAEEAGEFRQVDFKSFWVSFLVISCLVEKQDADKQ